MMALPARVFQEDEIMLVDWNDVKPGGKPLKRMGPWVWAVELVRGCNFKCWHCSARVFPSDGKTRFMKRKTWESVCDVVSQITPHGRLEFGQCGEPTLHPELLDFLRIANERIPTTQIQVYTNGTGLLKGSITFDELFEAGVHSVYVDMYSQVDKFIEMAKATGADWYRYYKSKKVGSENHKMANTYYGDPNMRLIVLQDCPETRLGWRKVGRLSTFLNHIDWDVAIPHGLLPVRKPYKRKCTIPMRFVTMDHRGNYLFCCIDFECEAAGLMGNVRDGVEGFKKYWFGHLMQSIRRRLNKADRAGIPYCSRCNCAFSKCDWTSLWGGDHAFDEMWDGERWVPVPDFDSEEEKAVFADGWEKTKKVQASLPTEEEEAAILASSKKKLIINSKDVVAIKKKKTMKGFFDEVKGDESK